MKYRSLAVIGVLWWACVAGPSMASAQDCSRSVVGVGLEHARGWASAFLGHAIGQSFVTSDTLMVGLSVWRTPYQGNSEIGLKLYITELDSLGVPLLDRIVYSGRTLTIVNGDTLNPTEFRWEMDPPLALPHRGGFAFFLAQDPCVLYVDVYTTAEDVGLYADGIVWITGRSPCRLIPGNLEPPYPRADLIFRAEFCQDTTTPTQRSTWGKVKARYR
jgi:hypothetical protein